MLSSTDKTPNPVSDPGLIKHLACHDLIAYQIGFDIEREASFIAEAEICKTCGLFKPVICCTLVPNQLVPCLYVNVTKTLPRKN